MMAELQKITIYDVVDDIRANSETEAEKGTRFERTIRYFLLNDPLWSARLKNVWMWKDAPTNNGHDIGIDLVGLDRGDGSYWAIQCKCYDTILDIFQEFSGQGRAILPGKTCTKHCAALP